LKSKVQYIDGDYLSDSVFFFQAGVFSFQAEVFFFQAVGIPIYNTFSRIT